MRKSKNEIEQRRENIIDFLIDNGESYLEDVANFLSISTLTVRRDIDNYRTMNIIEQKNGKIVLSEDYQKKLRLNKYSEEIAKIQMKAASFVQENDVIFINNSYTALGIVKYIPDIHCTVITNNTNILNITRNKSVVAMLTGGEIREPNSSIIGDIAVNTISRINANKVFVGVGGLSLESGLSASVFQEATITELMLKSCKGNRFVVLTSDKINNTDFFFCGGLNLVDTIITDNKVEILTVYELRRQGIEVIIQS